MLRKESITKLIQTWMMVLEVSHQNAESIHDLDKKLVEQFLVQFQKEL